MSTTTRPVPDAERAGPGARDGGLPTAVRARLVGASVFTLTGMIAAAAFDRGQGPATIPDPTTLAFTLLAWLPLLGRARWPLPTLVTVLLVECTHIAVLGPPAADASSAALMGFYQPTPIATMVAAFSVAYRTPRKISWIAGAGAAALLAVVGLVGQPWALLATDLVMFNLVAGATIVGSAVREQRRRRAREAADRAAETRRHIVAERVRIARELHDSLAHHLTLVNSQIGVASYLVGADPAAAATALKDITLHTRQALDELRATVGLLRQDDDIEPPPSTEAPTSPIPGLHRLAELLAGFRTAGTSVELSVAGTPVDLPAAVDLAAYRIVQESLTNATRHAGGAPVRIGLVWSPRYLEIEVVNAPAAGRHRRTQAGGTGHGLIGMRERAHHVGGAISTGSTPDGGYAVAARLPVTGQRDTEPDRIPRPQ